MLALLLFVVTSAFSSFKQKDIVGNWMIYIEGTQQANSEEFRKEIEENKNSFVNSVYLNLKKEHVFVMGDPSEKRRKKSKALIL